MAPCSGHRYTTVIACPSLIGSASSSWPHVGHSGPLHSIPSSGTVRTLRAREYFDLLDRELVFAEDAGATEFGKLLHLARGIRTARGWRHRGDLFSRVSLSGRSGSGRDSLGPSRSGCSTDSRPATDTGRRIARSSELGWPHHSLTAMECRSAGVRTEDQLCQRVLDLNCLGVGEPEVKGIA